MKLLGLTEDQWARFALFMLVPFMILAVLACVLSSMLLFGAMIGMGSILVLLCFYWMARHL